MRESLTFPYTAGMRFQDVIYRKLGTLAFERVFREAPLSTQEILHPETYADEVLPTHPVLPKQVPGTGAKLRLLGQGDVGELDYSILLRQYIHEEDGHRVARGWRGASYRLYEDKKTKKPLLIHVSEWNSPEAARDFFRGYAGVLRGKFESIQVERDSATEFTGVAGTGKFSLQLSGLYVQSVEGLDVSSGLMAD
jgi:hypothetical protein